MANGQRSAVLQFIHGWAGTPGSGDPTDEQLLDCFINRRDEAAFRALVSRYGPMVLGICRRVLANVHDAEDAFQATFLVLVRKAGTLDTRRPLGNWLYTVAFNAARRAKAGAARRRKYEASAPAPEVPCQPDPLTLSELRAMLDEELSRLPAKYRAPLVLCYLQGKTNEEAAGQLGWTKGTVSGRLARARDLLRGRLSRRGLALSSAALAAALETAPARAAVPAPLLAAAVRSALTAAAGSAAGALPFPVAVLAQGVLRAMFLTKLKIAAAAALAAAAFGAGAGALSYYGAAREPVAAAEPDQSKPRGDQRAADEPIADLQKALKNPDAAERRRAASAFGSLGPRAEPAVLSLIYALKDEDAEVRQRAAVALGDIGPAAKAAVPVLLSAVKDKEAGVRLRSATALEKIGTNDARVRLKYVAALGSLGKAAVPLLIPRLAEGEVMDVREAAARSLGEIGPDAKAAAPALAKWLQPHGEGEQQLAKNAVSALQAMGSAAAAAVPALTAAISRENPISREAIAALSAIGPSARAAAPALVACLKDWESGLQTECLAALAKIEPAALDAPLLESVAIAAPDERVRLMAADYLLKGKGSAKAIVPSLMDLLKDGDFEARKQAARLLGTCGPAAREAIPLLVAALADGNAGVRHEAARALRRIDPEGSARIGPPPDELPPEVRSPADLRAYARARRDAARKTFEYEWNAFLAGRAFQERIFEWSRRWLEAETAVAGSKAERLAAFQAHRERMVQIEDVDRLKYDAGRVAIQDLTAAEYHRLEAEIWLTEEKWK